MRLNIIFYVEIWTNIKCGILKDSTETSDFVRDCEEIPQQNYELILTKF